MTTKAQNVKPFDLLGHEVRTVQRGDERWYLAADVCKALGLVNISHATTRLDDDENALVSLGSEGEQLIISEPGFYKLILTSRKPEAEAFQDWLFDEVLPTLRKTGRYDMAQPPQPPLSQARSELDKLQQMIEAMRAQEARQKRG